MVERETGGSSAGAVLVERGGKFHFYQPGTSVIASDANIEVAYSKFSQALRDFQEQVDAAGLAVDEPPAAVAAIEAHVDRRGAVAELALFLAKTCIVLVVVGGLLAFAVGRAASGISAAVDNALKPMSGLSLADVSRKASEIVKDMHSLSKEDREKLRESIGEISREITPLVETWRNPPASQQPDGKTDPAKNSTGR